MGQLMTVFQRGQGKQRSGAPVERRLSSHLFCLKV